MLNQRRIDLEGQPACFELEVVYIIAIDLPDATLSHDIELQSLIRRVWRGTLQTPPLPVPRLERESES